MRGPRGLRSETPACCCHVARPFVAPTRICVQGAGSGRRRCILRVSPLLDVSPRLEGEGERAEGMNPLPVAHAIGPLTGRPWGISSQVSSFPLMPPPFPLGVECHAMQSRRSTPAPTRQSRRRRYSTFHRPGARACGRAGFAGTATPRIRGRFLCCPCHGGSESRIRTMGRGSFSLAWSLCAPCSPPCAAWQLRS